MSSGGPPGKKTTAFAGLMERIVPQSPASQLQILPAIVMGDARADLRRIAPTRFAIMEVDLYRVDQRQGWPGK
jgi:hypothetical protein